MGWLSNSNIYKSDIPRISIYGSDGNVVDSEVLRFRCEPHINLNGLVSRNVRSYLTELCAPPKCALLGLPARDTRIASVPFS